MKFLVPAFALVALSTAAVVGFNSSSSASAAPRAATPAPTVSVVRTSDDAREMFSFRMLALVTDSDQRVILVDGAGIDARGFVSHEYVYANETAVEEQFIAGGPRHRMIVRRNVPTWTQVQSADDLTVVVEAVQ